MATSTDEDSDEILIADEDPIVMPQEAPIDDRIILLEGVATDDAATLQARHKHIINNGVLSGVMNMFRRCGYLGTNYYELGLALHVAKYRLDNIAKNSKGDLDQCIIECLLAWLRDPEITDEKTWETLIAALRSIGEDAIAEKCYCERCKSCIIFSDYYLQIFQSINEPLKLAQALYAMRVLEQASVNKIQEAKEEESKYVLLRAVQRSICKNREILELFALALKEFPATATLSDEILKAYNSNT